MRVLVRLLAALLALSGTAHALEPERREVVVVSSRAWDGHVYRETFVPSTHAGMSLMAGRDSAISFVRTQEYYWPLSRRTYVDFQHQREEIGGVLNITQAGRTIAEEPLSAYAIVYPDGAAKGDGHLVWGEEADRAFAQYQEDERAFARGHVEARRAHAAYERRLLEAAAARARGEAAADIAPPPPLPEPSLRLVTKPVPGFRVALDPGVYQIELASDGAAVAGTRRTLSVLDVAGRDVVVADIVPEERWTRPLAANSEAARIFARPGTTFYVTLMHATRFDEAEYLPVVSPQANVAPGRDMWVRRGPAEGGRLGLSWDDGEIVPLDLARLKVEQTHGSGFGYRVRAARDSESEDLLAFAVSVPEGRAASRGHLRFEQPGAAPTGRETVVVQPRDTARSLLLALAPALVGIGLAASRLMRRPTRREPQD